MRRRVKDDVIAAVLRLQPEDVAPRREAALDRLAWDLGIHDEDKRAKLPDELRSLPDNQWPSEFDAPPKASQDSPKVEAPAPAAEPKPPPAPPPPAPAYEPPARPPEASPPAYAPLAAAADTPPTEPKPEQRRRRRGALWFLVLAGALIGAVLAIVLINASDDDKQSQPSAAAAPEGPAPKPVAMEALVEGFPGTGTAEVVGTGDDRRLKVSLRDLPPREEAYGVWLYNSIGDARLIDSAVGSTQDVDEPLPGRRRPVPVRGRLARADRREPEPQWRERSARAARRPDPLDAGAQDLDRDLGHLRGVPPHADPPGLERLGLRLRGAGGAGNDRARVAHRLPGGAVKPAMYATTGFVTCSAM